MTLHQSIIDEINAVLGDNVDDLHKSALLVTKYTNDLKELEGKVCIIRSVSEEQNYHDKKYIFVYSS